MKKPNIVKYLEKVVGAANVMWQPEDLLTYSYDGSIDRAMPCAVVLPDSAEEVAECVRIALSHGVAICPRGAGTGLSGGAIPLKNSLAIGTARMSRILEVDTENRIAVVEPGVVNAKLSEHVAKYDLFYAPDPSSQKACTLGGNVGENAGGPHCLALGSTSSHILGLEVALSDGSLIWLGGKTRSEFGLDLRGVIVGSEGMLCIVTKIIVRLLRKPEAVRVMSASFSSLGAAAEVVSDIIARGMVPAAMEIMDRTTLDACEPVYNPGYPTNAEAVLIVEVDGLREAVDEQSEDVEAICISNNSIDIRVAEDPVERERLWAIRKGAIGAFGNLAPSYYLVDGVVPRTVLPEVLLKVQEIGAEFGLTIGNVFHAGDGNLHPCILFNESDVDQVRRVIECGERILSLCVEYGGALSGEHGIGIEKQQYMSLVFNKDDLDVMQELMPAFGADGWFNQGKVFPGGAIHGDSYGMPGYAVKNTSAGGVI